MTSSLVHLSDADGADELMKVARRTIRTLKTCSRWDQVPPPIQMAMKIGRELNCDLGHGIMTTGRLPWVDDELVSSLRNEAFSLRKNANIFPGGYHKWITAGDAGKAFTESDSMLKLVRDMVGKEIVPTSWNYNFYNVSGESAYPHLDVPHAPINGLMMLSHDFVGAPMSKLVVYPIDSDPVFLQLTPGDFVLFWAGTTVHERTPIGAGESVCIVNTGYNIV